MCYNSCCANVRRSTIHDLVESRCDVIGRWIGTAEFARHRCDIDAMLSAAYMSDTDMSICLSAVDSGTHQHYLRRRPQNDHCFSQSAPQGKHRRSRSRRSGNRDSLATDPQCDCEDTRTSQCVARSRGRHQHRGELVECVGAARSGRLAYQWVHKVGGP